MATRKPLVVEVFDGVVHTFYGLADKVEVSIKRSFGAMVVTIDKHGQVLVEAQDGEGNIFNTRTVTIDPDDFLVS